MFRVKVRFRYSPTEVKLRVKVRFRYSVIEVLGKALGLGIVPQGKG